MSEQQVNKNKWKGRRKSKNLEDRRGWTNRGKNGAKPFKRATDAAKDLNEMTSLSSFASEILEGKGVLSNRFDTQPYEWKNFCKIAKEEGLEVDKDDDDYEIVHNGKEVLARFDDDELEVFTDIEKADFYKVALHKKSGILKNLA